MTQRNAHFLIYIKVKPTERLHMDSDKQIHLEVDTIVSFVIQIRHVLRVGGGGGGGMYIVYSACL